MLLFLQLYLGHLVADFILQPDWIARNKRQLRALIAHAGIHLACASAAVNIGLNQRVFIVIVGLAIVHTLLDYLKARLSSDDWITFTIDQATHLAAVALASVWLVASWTVVIAALSQIAKDKRVYLYLCAYVGVILGGGYLIQKVTQSFLAKMQANSVSSKPGLPDAGKYIGWVERFLILTFVIAGYDTAIGLLLTAKAVVRFPEIREDTKGHFAEYFLVGTLTSVGLALVAGLAVKKIGSLMGQ